MKINSIWIPISLAVIFLVIVGSGFVGVDITMLFNLAVIAIPLALIIYLLNLGKRYVDLKMVESNTNIDIKTRIEKLNESMERIEKRIDNIEKILQKVSE